MGQTGQTHKRTLRLNRPRRRFSENLKSQANTLWDVYMNLLLPCDLLRPRNQSVEGARAAASL